MSEREVDLRCVFDGRLPCLDGCALRLLVLRMLKRYSPTPPDVDVVREFIVTCPSRRRDGERAITGGVNNDIKEKFCLHFRH